MFYFDLNYQVVANMCCEILDSSYWCSADNDCKQMEQQLTQGNENAEEEENMDYASAYTVCHTDEGCGYDRRVYVDQFG